MVRVETEISLFLKARRAALSPEQVGLPSGGGRRRVRGLRREEVAQLAGVSVDYYTRIEQGRGGAVSAEVLDVLARALRMSEPERGYLHDLASQVVRGSGGASAAGRFCEPPEAPRPTVRPEVRYLVDAMAEVPALVIGHGLDLLVWNRLAERLWPDLAIVPEEDLNLARLLFRYPRAATLHADVETMRREMVAKLRADSGRTPDDPRLCRVVMELRRDSARFRELWEEREVREQPHGVHRMRHPLAGELELYFEKLPLRATPAQTLLTYTAEPGSASEERLRALAATDPAISDR
ncbi:helix-turn-helix transcriptional regulator [Halostreptopolyspora alba]|uniref:XRE family transcriptional regulator n=1 Tax=Halostreptopolyspora alba TaxID=2487137 RepID=A0A3N0E8T1_9ACTN|nr:XRE family transcriptional regulator [Nocardiopsaceae bacterium YIM 96095]